MKSIVIVCFLLIAGQTSLLAQNTGYTKEFVNQVDNSNSNFIEVPSTFSENEISKNKISQVLVGKTIEKIELIYTQFKLNPEFDQEKLNDSRIAALQKSIPETKNNGIDWVWVEQTGAKTVEEARDYYHGFRIYYSDQNSNQVAEKEETNEQFHRYQFEDKANKPTQFVVNNSKGGDIKHPSGTVIHVPANCVLTPDGKPVVGSYILEYTEYRDAAQIAYSGIPMEYHSNGEKFNFNSVGMYELRGSQNDRELSLTKPITVDFKSNEVAEEVGFFEMDDNTGEWVKKHDVKYGNTATQIKPTAINMAETEINETALGSDRKNAANPETFKGVILKESFDPKDKNPNENKKTLTLTKPMMDKYTALQKTEKAFMDQVVLTDNIEKMTVTVNNFNEVAFVNKVQGIQPRIIYSVDPGHIFPSMVSGLYSPNFGVYNCDQVRRIPNQVSVSPIYKTKDSTDAPFAVACVIDKNVNGSFSFSPQNLTYNKQANTTILLFDADGKLSAVTNEEVHKSNGNKTPEFKVEDLSNTVHDSNELKEYLKL